MDTNRVSVLVLRRMLSRQGEDAIQKLFPGRQLDIRITNPADFREHDQNCQDFKADLVILPEKPIPALAMERGVPHVIIAPDGQLLELLLLKPEFKPFKPNG